MLLGREFSDAHRYASGAASGDLRAARFRTWLDAEARFIGTVQATGAPPQWVALQHILWHAALGVYAEMIRRLGGPGADAAQDVPV